MAYEALANVLANIGKGYEARMAEDRKNTREDELYQRQLADKRADAETERGFVRERDAARVANEIKLEEERRKIIDKSTVEMVEKLSEAQLRALAKQYGVDVGSDGAPNSLAMMKELVIQKEREKLAQDELSNAQAKARAAVDPTVLDAEKQRTEARVKNETAAARNANTDSYQASLDYHGQKLQSLTEQLNNQEGQAAKQRLNDMIAKITSFKGSKEAKDAKVSDAEIEVAEKSGDLSQIQAIANKLAFFAMPADKTQLQAIANEQRTSVMVTAQQVIAEQNALNRVIEDASKDKILLNFDAIKSTPKTDTNTTNPAGTTGGTVLPKTTGGTNMPKTSAARSAPSAGSAVAGVGGGGASATTDATRSAGGDSAAPVLEGTPAWWSTQRDGAANQKAVIDFFKGVPSAIYSPIEGVAQRMNPQNYVPGYQAGVDAAYSFNPNRAAVNRARDAAGAGGLPDMGGTPPTPSPQPIKFGPQAFSNQPDYLVVANRALAERPAGPWSEEEMRAIGMRNNGGRTGSDMDLLRMQNFMQDARRAF